MLDAPRSRQSHSDGSHLSNCAGCAGPPATPQTGASQPIGPTLLMRASKWLALMVSSRLHSLSTVTFSAFSRFSSCSSSLRTTRFSISKPFLVREASRPILQVLNVQLEENILLCLLNFHSAHILRPRDLDLGLGLSLASS